MGVLIPRGGTCRITFYLEKGLNVGSLGDPYIAITQEYASLMPDAQIDTVHNCVYADLLEAETFQLVENVTTKAQLTFESPTGNIYRFPIHELSVQPTIIGTLLDDEAYNITDEDAPDVDSEVPDGEEEDPDEGEGEDEDPDYTDADDPEAQQEPIPSNDTSPMDSDPSLDWVYYAGE